MKTWALSYSVVLLLSITFSQSSLALGIDCDNVDGLIAEAEAAAKADFKRAAELQGAVDGMDELGEILDILNPIPTSAVDFAQAGAEAACEAALGTVGQGINATVSALQIANSLMNNNSSALQGMVRSNIATGRGHLEEANRLRQWKLDNCKCVDATEEGNPEIGGGAKGEDGSDTDYITDDSGKGSGSGASGAAGGAAGDSGAGGSREFTQPDWSKIKSFSKEEVDNAIGWIDSELQQCRQFPTDHVRSCASAATTYVPRLKQAINKGISKSSSTSERLTWVHLQQRIDDAKREADAMKRSQSR